MKKIIILSIIILLFGLVSLFHGVINRNIERIMFDKFDMINTHNNLLVHYVSVGQGDAIAIRLPNDEIMLIDTGPKSSNVSFTNYLEDKVVNDKHDRVIDYLILTHADIDHIGGTLRALMNFEIKKLFMPKINSTSQYYQTLVDFVEGKYDYDFLDSDDLLDVGECELRVFSTPEYKNTNDSSVVIRLEYLDKSFLFTGDITKRVERDLIKIYSEELDSDVLKVAHHGSENSTSIEFLDYVSPEYAVISVGDNYYGHPTDAVLERLEDRNINIFRTDLDGNILFAVGENIGLRFIAGEYIITGLCLDIRLYSCMIITGLSVVIIIAVVPKGKKKD